MLLGPAGPLHACGLSQELRQVPQEFAGKRCWMLAGDVIHPMEKSQIVRELPACSDCSVCAASKGPWLVVTCA